MGNWFQFPRTHETLRVGTMRLKSGLTAKSIAIRLGAGKTETNVVVPVVRVVVVPVDGTDVRSIVVPVPAAYYAVNARWSC